MVREHRKEFFDRDYSAREAYGRLWQYARKYWPRLALGVICGVLTAGTLVPMFSMIQPVLAKVESHQERKVPGGPDAGGQTVRCSEMQESRANDVSGKEARKLLHSPEPGMGKRRPYLYGTVWAAGGSLLTGLVWLLTVLV